MFEKNRNLVAGSFLFLFSGIYYLLSFQIQLTNIDKQVGSRLLPQICGVLMMLFSAWLVIDNIVKNRKGIAVEQIGEDDSIETNDKPKPNYLNTVLVLLGFALYIFLMGKIGFIVSTILYLFSQMILLEQKGKKKHFVRCFFISAISATIIYLLFNQIFHLILPRGILI